MTSADEPAWPLVGREVQIERASRALRAGRGVVIAGDAGVGKTTVARVLADLLDDDLGRDITRLAATSTTGLPIEAFGALTADGSTGDAHVVFVDDVQLLDDDAAALLHRLTVERRIVLVGTLRTGEPAPDAVTAMWKDDLVDRIDLAPLDRREIDDLLDRVLAGPIDAAVRREMWDLTLGWPLMFRELIRSSLDSDILRSVDGLWRFVEAPRSGRLDELIGARLDALDERTRAVTELVALGEPLGFELLRAAVDVDAIDAAERAGVIEIVRDDVRFDARLAHPIFGDVLRRTMSATRTAVVSGQLLELLERTPMRRRDDIVRATTWQLRAGGAIVTDDMVLATRRALYADEQRLAIELATRALKGDPTRTDVALLLAQALVTVGEPKRAEDELVGPDGELPGHALDPGERAMVAMQRAIALFWGVGDAPRAEAVVEEAIAETPAGHWHDELRAERALLASNQGRHREAAAIVDPLLASGVDEIGARAFVTASISASCTRALDGRCLDALDLCHKAFALCVELGPQPALTLPGIFIVSQATALTEAGRFAEAEQLARGARDFVVSEGQLVGQAWFSMSLGRILLSIGRFEEAERRFEEASAAFAGIHSHGPRHWSLAGAVMAAAGRGDAAAARRWHRDRQALAPHPAGLMDPEVARSEAWLAFVDGDRAASITRLRTAVEEYAPGGANALLGWLLHDIVRFGGTVEPDDIEVLDGCEGELVPARLALMRAVRDRDPDAAEAAAARFATSGSPLFAAEAALLAASGFAERGDTRAEARCRRTAADHRAAVDHGPVTTIDALDRRAPDPLTPREREVATIAAGGRTNKEVADELYVSVRTVENHLQHVYEKLGVSGRRELSAVLAT